MMENPNLKWMIIRGPPIYGNPQVSFDDLSIKIGIKVAIVAYVMGLVAT